MWNDWLSSLTGPSGDATDTDIPEPIETPRRFSNPHSIEKLQSLQTQHQQLQVHQLHLLNQQFKLQKELTDSGDSTCTDGGSSAPQSPSSGVSNVLAEAFKCTAGDVKPPNASGSKLKIKTEPSDVEERGMDHTSLPTEVWQQFHAIQAQQWAQALNQARLAKRSPGGVLMGGSTPLSGNLGLLTQGHVSSSGSGLSGGKRCKAYAAPKGVWKNNGGYNATIYVHKRRIYGPIRRDLSDAIEDRKEMEDALRELTAVHNSPEDAAVLEVEMREVVAGLRNRSTPGRMDVPASRLLGTQGNMMGASVITPGSNDGTRKRLRLVGPTSTPLQSPQMTHAPAESPDLMFAPPMQIKDELSLYDTSDLNGTTFMGDMLGGDNGAFGTSARIGYTPNVGPQGAPFQQNVYGTPMHTGFGSSGLDDVLLLENGKKPQNKISAELFVKCLTSVGPKFKTVSALTRRVSELESKALHRAKLVEKMGLKDQRKRSLNFHKFSTVQQLNTEVARSTLRQSRGESQLPFANSKELCVFLNSSTMDSQITVLNYPQLVKAVISNFDQISPNVYPKLLELIAKYGEGSSRSDSLKDRISDRVSLSQSAQEGISKIGGWPCLFAYLEFVPEPIGNMLVSTWNPVMDFSQVDHVLTYLSRRPKNSSKCIQLTESLLCDRISSSLKPNLPAPVLALFHSSVPPVCPIRLFDCIYRYVSLGRICSKPFIRVLNLFILHHSAVLPLGDLMQVMGTLTLDCARSVILSSIRTRMSIDTPVADLEAMARCAKLVKFDSRFPLTRLTNRLHKAGVEDDIRNVHNTMFQQLNRTIRKRHELMQTIRIGRVDHELLSTYNPRIACTCRVCRKFNHELHLAKSFHSVL